MTSTVSNSVACAALILALGTPALSSPVLARPALARPALAQTAPQTAPAQTQAPAAPRPGSGITRNLNAEPPGAYVPVPIPVPAPQPAPQPAPAPVTARPATTAPVVTPARPATSPTPRPATTAPAPSASPAPRPVAPATTAPARTTPAPATTAPTPRVVAPSPAVSPVPTPAPVAAPPVVAPPVVAPPVVTPPAAPAPMPLDASAIAALPFTVDLPAGFTIVPARSGADFKVYSIRRRDRTFVMIEVGPSTMFPIYTGESVQAAGRTSIVVTDNGQRRAVEHLFERATAPREIHAWVSSLEGADRGVAEQIAQSVDDR